MGYVTWPRPFQGRFVIHKLGLAMFNPHIKFEMSTITCNEEMKGNAKCKKNLVLSHPLGDFMDCIALWQDQVLRLVQSHHYDVVAPFGDDHRRLNVGTYQYIFSTFIHSFTRWRDITTWD